jgi:hypothetical protein
LGFDRITVNVARYSDKILFRFYQNRPVAAPKHRPISAVPSVKSLGVDPIKMPHHPGKRSVGGLNKKMIVIVHETVRIDLETPHLGGLAQQIQKTLPIMIVKKDLLPGRASIHDMIVGAAIFNPQGT